MAELIGTVASVAQLVQLSGTLLAGGYGFLSKVNRAPSEIRSLLTETAAINSLLGQLQVIADSTPKPAPDDALQALERLGVFRECQTTLKSIQKALDACEQIHGKEVRNFGRRLIWPFKEKETKDALQRLHHMRGLLANAIEANSASALRRIEASQGQLMDEVTFLSDNAKTQISREETQTVVAWLCPQPSENPQISLENALSRRLPGTGAWFLESDTFKDWLMSKSGTIWITGLPGSGKTVLCSSIIEKVREFASNTTAVLFFLCDHRDSSKRTLENFLVSITKQMLELSPACLKRAKDLYEEKRKKSERTFNRSEYPTLIESFLCEFKDAFIIVDALDEASEGDEIANMLTRMHSTVNTSVKVIFSSRFDIRIERKHSFIASTRVALAENTRQDIERYVKIELFSRVDKGIVKLRNKDLMLSIQEQVGLRAGTLLQARLQLDYLSTATTDRGIKEMMQNLPNGLEYTYETLLCSTKSRYPTRINEVRILLQCLTCAASPLSAFQLSEIMAMRSGERFLDFDAVTTDPYDTLEAIAPFVVVDREKEALEFIKPSHYSLVEYLCSENIRQGPARHFYVDTQEANAWLASICLQYLTFSLFDIPLDESPVEPDLDVKQKYTLLRYAALNWFKHMYNARKLPGFKERYEPYLGWFVNGGHGPPCYERWQQIFWEAYPYNEAGFHSPICFAIWAGLDGLVEYLLPMLSDLDYRFADGFTCLTVAAMSNRVGIVRKLLDLGASINLLASESELSPIHFAAEFGCQETFDILLDAGADPHIRSASGTTPFYRAARGGNIHILKRLKDCGSDVNALTFDRWTPLLEAVENEHEEVVDLLLEWGADPAITSREGVSAISLAEDLSHQSIEQKLHQVLGSDSRNKHQAVSGSGEEDMEIDQGEPEITTGM